MRWLEAVVRREPTPEEQHAVEVMLEYRAALGEVESARQALDWATGPAEVDEALHRLRAAEIRLSRVLQQIRSW